MKPLRWSPELVEISSLSGIDKHIITQCDKVVGFACQGIGCRFAVLARLQAAVLLVRILQARLVGKSKTYNIKYSFVPAFSF